MYAVQNSKDLKEDLTISGVCVSVTLVSLPWNSGSALFPCLAVFQST